MFSRRHYRSISPQTKYFAFSFPKPSYAPVQLPTVVPITNVHPRIVPFNDALPRVVPINNVHRREVPLGHVLPRVAQITTKFQGCTNHYCNNKIQYHFNVRHQNSNNSCLCTQWIMFLIPQAKKQSIDDIINKGQNKTQWRISFQWDRKECKIESVIQTLWNLSRNQKYQKIYKSRTQILSSTIVL